MRKFRLALVAVLVLAPVLGVAQRVDIMSYNIRNGVGIDNVCDLGRTAMVIEEQQAHVVGLQEVDSVTNRSKGVDVLGFLATKCDMTATYARAIAYDGGAYGVGLLSKDKPRKVRRIPLDGREEARVLLIAEFAKYVVFNTHLSLTAADQSTSIEKIVALAAEYRKPVVVLGDLNLDPASEQFALLSKHFTLLSDKQQPTFPADKPDTTIDYVWGSPGYKYSVERAAVIDAPVQSDHRPIVANFLIQK